MPNYRRLRIAGGRYFFTVNLADRRSSLLTDRIVDLRHAVQRVRELAPFRIDAWVVLPDHMHAMWTLPEADDDFPRRWRTIKDLFSRRLDPDETLSRSRASQGERGIWQRRYWEHAIRDERDFGVHMDYVHFNPVKHGFVSHPADWPHSSFRACVAKGPLPARLDRLRRRRLRPRRALPDVGWDALWRPTNNTPPTQWDPKARLIEPSNPNQPLPPLFLLCSSPLVPATVIPFSRPIASPDPVLQAGLAELFQFGLTIARVAKRFAEVEEGAINALAEAAATVTRAAVTTPTSLGSAIQAGTDADASEDARNSIAARLASITDSYDKAARAVRRTAALQARLAEARPWHNPAKDPTPTPGPRPAAGHPANDAEPTDRPDWDDETNGRTDEEVLDDVHRDLQPGIACLSKAPGVPPATHAQPQSPPPPLAPLTTNVADTLPEPDT